MDNLDKLVCKLNSDGSNIYEVYKNTLLYSKTGSIKSILVKKDEFLNSKLYNFILSKTNFLNSDSSLKCRIYCLQNNITTLPKCKCGKLLAFLSRKNRFKLYCSQSCLNIYGQHIIINGRINNNIETIWKKFNSFKKIRPYFKKEEFIIHNNVYKWQCKECNYIFESTSSLREHKIKKCSQCREYRILKRKLIKSRHIHIGKTKIDFNNLQKIYTWYCNKCNNPFKSSIQKNNRVEACPHCRNNKFKEKYWNKIKSFKRSIPLFNKDDICESRTEYPFQCIKCKEIKNISKFGQFPTCNCEYKQYFEQKKIDAMWKTLIKNNKHITPLFTKEEFDGYNKEYLVQCNTCLYKYNSFYNSKALFRQCPKCKINKYSDIRWKYVLKQKNVIPLFTKEDFTSVKKKYKWKCRFCDNIFYRNCGKYTSINNCIKCKQNQRWQILNNNCSHVIPLFNKKEYKGMCINYKWQCKSCSHVYIAKYSSRGVKQCPKCFPKNYGKTQNIIFKFIDKITLSETIKNTYSVIPPKELDIYIPKRNIAIEYNGLYWHSVNKGCKKFYHLNKTKKCNKLGINLIHIFEDEWIYKENNVKNKLKLVFNRESFNINHKEFKNKIRIDLKNRFFKYSFYFRKISGNRLKVNNLLKYGNKVLGYIEQNFNYDKVIIINNRNWCYDIQYSDKEYKHLPIEWNFDIVEQKKEFNPNYAYTIFDTGYKVFIKNL